METYELKLCGLTRHLPLTYVGKNTKLANFSLLGDVELTEKIAEKFIEMLKPVQHDIIVGPEVKVVPLISALARRLKQKRFVVCRKSVKPYMMAPVILKPLEYFPKHVRQLVIDGEDAKLLKGKSVVIVDDVVSTGVTLRMIAKLMEKVGAEVVSCVAVLKQGDQFPGTPEFSHLANLPVFK